MDSYLCGLPPKNPQPQCIWKNIRQIALEGQSTKYLTSTPQDGHGHQKQGNSEKLSQPF